MSDHNNELSSILSSHQRTRWTLRKSWRKKQLFVPLDTHTDWHMETVSTLPPLPQQQGLQKLNCSCRKGIKFRCFYSATTMVESFPMGLIQEVLWKVDEWNKSSFKLITLHDIELNMTLNAPGGLNKRCELTLWGAGICISTRQQIHCWVFVQSPTRTKCIQITI